MKTIKLIDMTLTEAGKIRDSALTFKEKLEVARILDRLKVDIIELPAIRSGKADQLSNKTIAAMVNIAITAQVDIIESSVEETWLPGTDGICLSQESSCHARADPGEGQRVPFLLRDR